MVIRNVPTAAGSQSFRHRVEYIHDPSAKMLLSPRSLIPCVLSVYGEADRRGRGFLFFSPRGDGADTAAACCNGKGRGDGG